MIPSQCINAIAILPAFCLRGYPYYLVGARVLLEFGGVRMLRAAGPHGAGRDTAHNEGHARYSGVARRRGGKKRTESISRRDI